MKKNLFWILGSCLLLFYYPIIVSALLKGTLVVFNSFAADTFYYLTVAKNYKIYHMTTFDGTTVTNGFHPLWQFLLITIFSFLKSLETQIIITYVICTILTFTGIVFAALAITKITNSRWAFVWLFPGLFYVIFRECHAQEYGLNYTYTFWSFTNGLESPLSICFCGILIFLISDNFFFRKESPENTWDSGLTRKSLLIGVVLSFLILSRLDDVFILPGLAIALLFSEGAPAIKIKKILLTCTLPSLALIAYMTYNYHSVGTVLPVSGQLKMFNSFNANALSLLRDFFPFTAGASEPFTAMWAKSTNRQLGIIIPIILLSLFAIYALRFRKTDPRRYHALFFIAPLAIYIACKESYDFYKISLFHQGFWYHTTPITVVNIASILVVHDLIFSRQSEKDKYLKILFAVFWLLIYVQTSAHTVFSLISPNAQMTVFKERDRLTSELMKIDKDIALIDSTDGFTGYIFPFKTAAGTALCSNLEGVTAKRENRYLQFCYQNGYSVVAPNRGYLQDSLAALPPQEWSQNIIFQDDRTGMTFIKIKKIK